MKDERILLAESSRWVVKVGTSILTDSKTGLNNQVIASLARQIAKIQQQGVSVVLVSSGSISEGMCRLGWSIRPHQIHQLQAAAAVGQMGLIQSYEAAFKEFGIITAQILLTHADLANRQRYLNARSTLRELLKLGVVPIVNENDSVSNEEIRVGDNDTLAALTANLVEAECLVLLTDQDGLYDKDPRFSNDTKFIKAGSSDDGKLMQYAGSAGDQGRGGMQTKLAAARKAARSGAATVIASGLEQGVLWRLRQAEEIGTFLLPGNGRVAARKQWLAGQLRSSGRLILDEGAVEVIVNGSGSLLPIGVTAVEGEFSRGEIVECIDPNGHSVALGLVNYNFMEVEKILGKTSNNIESALGYCGESELIHRDNIATNS